MAEQTISLELAGSELRPYCDYIHGVTVGAGLQRSVV